MERSFSVTMTRYAKAEEFRAYTNDPEVPDEELKNYAIEQLFAALTRSDWEDSNRDFVVSQLLDGDTVLIAMFTMFEVRVNQPATEYVVQPQANEFPTVTGLVQL